MIVILHAAIAILNNNGQPTPVFVMVLLFLFVYQNTTGPVTWLYAAETTVDAGLGLCMFTLWITVFILTLICPVLMGKDILGPSNVFFIFSAFSAFGAFYSYYFIKETQGLSDKEKKSLFYPRKYKSPGAEIERE